MDNVYSFTVQRQNSSEVAPGKSPCVKIKFIKDESIKNYSPKCKMESISPNVEEKTDLISEDISAESSPLSICPIYSRECNDSDNLKSVFIELFKLVEKRDIHMIFAYPVTEEQAPNYSIIIDHSMDMKTIQYKIDSGVYSCMVDLVDDVILMCQNALIYNTSETVYYKIATQMLNYVKKIFTKESLNKFITQRLGWTRGLSNEEMGDLTSCLTKIKLIQSEINKNNPNIRPHRALQKNVQQDFQSNKRKHLDDFQQLNVKKACVESGFDTLAVSPESDVEDGISNVKSELSDGDGDDEHDDNDDDDDDVVNEVLATAQKAASIARQRLQQSRPLTVVYLDQVGDDLAFINDKMGQSYKLSDDFQSMVKSIASVNVEQMIGENDRVLAHLGQLCHDTNESVTLTTSKPLEPYSCAEQAVLVETFGDVVTAEFACNMHNFVLDLPANNAALNAVRSKLNIATNYLTYGVDQIIIKKLKASADLSKL